MKFEEAHIKRRHWFAEPIARLGSRSQSIEPVFVDAPNASCSSGKYSNRQSAQIGHGDFWMRDDIIIETNFFEHREVKSHFINPCCFGEDFAAWLRGRLSPLAAEGFHFADAIQEDYGWGFWASHRGDRFLDSSLVCRRRAAGRARPVGYLGRLWCWSESS